MRLPTWTAKTAGRFDPGRVEDRDDVGYLGLEVGHPIGRHGIGEAGPAAIEVDEPREPAEATQKARVFGDFPDELDVVDPVVDKEQVDRPVADDLVGEMDVPVPGEARGGDVGHERIMGRMPAMTLRARLPFRA